MRVVILCGGQGTRLREETEYRPKPLVGIGDRPILWHIMKHYTSYGYNEFVLCLGYRGDMIKDYFLNYEAKNSDLTIKLVGGEHQIAYHDAYEEQDFAVTLANTGLDSMTGGRVLRVRKYVGDDIFMVTYGDGLSNVNLQELERFHRSHGCIATVTTVYQPSRYGVLKVNPDHSVKQFIEKPILEDRVSAGFFVFDRRIFDYLEDDSTVLEQEPLRRLVEDNQLMAFHHEGFFYAMDTYREYVYLNQLWASGDAPWKVK